MSHIVGHTRQREYFNAVIARKKVSHAYLFHGPEHVGKFTVARALAKVFFCKNFSAAGARNALETVCGSCSDCKLIEWGMHPDVYLIDPERTEKEGKRIISIDDIRDLKKKFSYAIGEDKRALAIINHADAMPREAANAFLKLLEEPPRNALFLLIASDKDALPSTIVSRTHSIYFSTVRKSEMLDFFSDQCDRTLMSEILSYADGKPGIVIGLLRDENLLRRERDIARASAMVFSDGISSFLRYSEKISADRALFISARHALYRTLRERLLRDAEGNSAREAVVRVKMLNRTMEHIDTTNVNMRLAMDALFLRIRACSKTI